MSLSPGTRLGPYEITGEVGAGGMGQVYRARDTRLDRAVAIKVLPEHLASRADLRERFEREARTVSSLNHPHICALYDIGEQAGIHYLVLEHLEGETLAKRLERGKLPFGELLEHAIPLADALDKAHRRGVIHRDLKPGNIMLAPSGAKLLDFGLAKSRVEGREGGPLSELGTLEAGLTAQGTILGTLPYMAPEQLEGKSVDTRADIFSFGAVLYEMATGKKAFQGGSHVNLMAAILEHQPEPISKLEAMTPHAFERLVQVCLAKDPEDRWQTARDVVRELEFIKKEGTRAPALAAATVTKRLSQRLAWVLAAAAGFLAITVTVASFLRRSPEPAPVRFEIPIESPFPNQLQISPNGRYLAFLGISNQGSILSVRPFDSLEARSLPGTEGALSPFWSPDSRWIGFFAQGKLKKVTASGGPPQTLCEASQLVSTGAWSQDDVIVFSSNLVFGGLVLHRVPASGGEPKALTALDKSKNESFHAYPQFLPGGKRYLYLAGGGAVGSGRVLAGSLDSKETKELVATDFRAMYAPPGSLLFGRDGSLMAQAFDVAKVEIRGEPVPVVEQISSGPPSAAYSVSDSGVLVFRPGGGALGRLTWYDRQGKTETVGPTGILAFPDLSPDGRRVAVVQAQEGQVKSDVWLIDLERGTSTRFTFDPSGDTYPIWSPDGEWIAFASDRAGNDDVYIKAASGAGSEEILIQTKDGDVPTDWSRDGRFLLVTRNRTGQRDILMFPRSRDREPIPVLETPFDERHGRFSPDGRWIAYASNESGNFEIYLQALPGSGRTGKWQISSGGGVQPNWRPDGKELFYLRPDNNALMAVDLELGDNVEAGVPRALFKAEEAPVFPRYSVSADGKRFLFNTRLSSESRSVVVVLNWTTGLKTGVAP